MNEHDSKRLDQLLDNITRDAAEAKSLLLGASSPLVASRSASLPPPKLNDQSASLRVVEGIFDGQNMKDTDGKNYPIPANYASKSKLVEGDHLKLTITEEGRFLFKQIGPVPRKSVVGPLAYEDGQYTVLGADGNTYRILLASITFFRANVGDEVSVLVPQEGTATWGAMDNVVPQG